MCFWSCPMKTGCSQLSNPSRLGYYNKAAVVGSHQLSRDCEISFESDHEDLICSSPLSLDKGLVAEKPLEEETGRYAMQYLHQRCFNFAALLKAQTMSP